jgi:type I restriction enzyme S subunit
MDRDVLITRKNTTDLVAACVLVRRPPPRLMLPDTIFRFTPREDSQVTPEYLWALFSFPSFRCKVQRLATGSAGSMPNISKEKFGEVTCPVPPRPSIDQFTEAVRQHTDADAVLREALRQAEHLFQSLLNQYFGESN